MQTEIFARQFYSRCKHANFMNSIRGDPSDPHIHCMSISALFARGRMARFSRAARNERQV